MKYADIKPDWDNKQEIFLPVWRHYFLLGLMCLGMLLLVARTTFLQVFDTSFLQEQGDRRHVDVVSVPAYRGTILDRNYEPLAISTPVESVWVNPQHFVDEEKGQFVQALRLLGLPADEFLPLWHQKKNGRRFAYLKRRIPPALADQIRALQVRGIYFDKEFKRYYPAGPVSGHVLGFTDIDDVGQEGVERFYDAVLQGVPGKKRVIRDGRRRIIKDVENIKDPVAGQSLVLSIDQRLQYIAFKALQKGVTEHQASSGSLVVLDAKNGEVLAVVNHPAFNPNTRKNLQGHRYRNRAFLDVFEPGSTVKPFVVAAALDGGYIDEDLQIETNGWFRINRNVVRDVHNYGTLDLTGVLKKSSNVAVSKIALRMPRDYFWGVYNQLGFGASANIGFPGEANGALLDFRSWNDFVQATLSYGYGVATSVLQLARAYTALADGGRLHSLSLLKREGPDEQVKQVFSQATAQKVSAMLEHVVMKGGTAYQARVDGYRVAGKTGTVKKAVAGGYTENTYSSVFVGFAPLTDPRFVIAVMVDEPTQGGYYGGVVAAPIFSEVMTGALRVYGIEPDQANTMPFLLTQAQ